MFVGTGVTGGIQQSVRNVSRERWGDIYCNMPVKRMIALYDYDPQELSPNVDAEVCVKRNILFSFYFYIFTILHIHTEILPLNFQKTQQNSTQKLSLKRHIKKANMITLLISLLKAQTNTYANESLNQCTKQNDHIF